MIGLKFLLSDFNLELLVVSGRPSALKNHHGCSC